jgi:hypothetical protein
LELPIPRQANYLVIASKNFIDDEGFGANPLLIYLDDKGKEISN